MNQTLHVRKKPSLFKMRKEVAPPDPVAIRQQIEIVAYSLYEERGRTSGRELDDWLEAERRVLNEQ